MWISFHDFGEADIDLICSDLQEHGIVYIDTTRPYGKQIANIVKERLGSSIMHLAKFDGNYHQFLINDEKCEYNRGTYEKIYQAIRRWMDIDSPVPHIEKI